MSDARPSDRGQRRLSRALAEYRAPAGPDGRAPVSLVEVMLIIPPGCTRPRTRRQIMRAAAARPELARFQGRRQAKLLTWLRIHVRWASWWDGNPDGPRATAWPTRARVCAEGGFQATTYRFCRRFWEGLGFVRVVREGRSKDAREQDKQGQPTKRKIARYPGNDAKVIVLLIPRQTRAKPAPVPPAAPAPQETRAPQASSPGLGDLRAREPAPGENPGTVKTGEDRAARGLTPGAMPRALAGHPLLNTLSDKGIARAWADFGACGWSASDWLWALDHRQDNRSYPIQLGPARRPAALIDWRLRQWRGEDGRPVLSRSQRAAVRRFEERQAAAAQAAIEAADRAASRLPPQRAGAPPSAEYVRIRESRGRRPRG